MQFDLVDFRLLVNIAEEKSLSRGAERSHLSIPAASNRIKNLESRIGMDLLYRNSQGVTLTPIGQSFLHHARIVLRQLEHLCGDLQEYTEGIKGHIKIFATTTAITELLPEPISRFLRAHPDVNITMQEHRSQHILRAVTEGSIDIGIVAENINHENVQLFPFGQDRLALVAPVDHPLVGRREVAFAETLDYDYVGLWESSAMHSFLVDASRSLNRPMKFRLEVGSIEAACRMVSFGVGIAMVPVSAARRYATSFDIRVIELSDDWARRCLQICVRNLEQLPVFARDLVAFLLATADVSAL
ncbi:LysR family transcriptional regulator [Pigmentiphaga soli]|uniref:LysR family transcriptional regulator n=2 Tax=Pigmentiphaga soli TaxID=1007095 RepID=A0ABP8H4K6_9BURK